MQILLQIAVLFAAQNFFTVPRLACKGKADPCTFLTVEKFVKGRSVNSSSDLSFDNSNSWCISAKNTPINQHIKNL